VSSYDVEIHMRQRGSRPFSVHGIQVESRVKELVDSYLASWGQPSPDLMNLSGLPIVDRLIETGEYRAECDDYVVIVKAA
jgi:hypothetical protein